MHVSSLYMYCTCTCMHQRACSEHAQHVKYASGPNMTDARQAVWWQASYMYMYMHVGTDGRS